MKFCSLDDKTKIQFIRDNIWIGDVDTIVDAYPEDLRINIFKTTDEGIHTAFKEGNINSLTSILKGKMATRVNNILSHNDLKETTVASIIDSEKVIEESIGLSEVISSLKGEINKATNKDVDTATIAVDANKNNPSLNMPIMRIAASIGRKVAYQKGFRFKKANNVDTAVEVEALYVTLGKNVLENLSKKGYITLKDDSTTIVDYENSSKPNRKRTKEEVESDKTTTEVESVSLNLDKIISKEDKASKSRDRIADLKYFTHNNVNSDLDTDLSKALAALKVVTSLTLPVGITFPDKVAEESKSKLTENDSFTGDPQYNEIRKELQNRPFTLNGSIHKLFKVLSNINGKTRGDSATKQLLGAFKSNPKALLSLFGIKNTDYYSVDKFDSVTGQNLSKSATLDDTVEYYPSLNYDGQSNLYMTIMNGDNTRGYYTNSVLNPQGSKLARYSLNVGEYKVKANSADYQAILESVVEGLGMDRTDKKSFEGILYGTNKKIENALKAFDDFNNVTDEENLGALSKPLGVMSSNLPNVPIAELLTSLQTIKELRDVDSNGDIQTSAMVSSDATASGGQITIAQALGTNGTVTGVLEKMSILENKSVKEDEKLRDVYHITEKGIDEFLEEDSGKIKRSEVLKEGETKDLISNIIEKLYKKNKRAFTKPPTMTFIYGQGRPAGSVSLVNSIVDTMLDSILDEQTISLIKDIIPKHKNSDVDLESVEGLRTDLTIALTEKDVGTAIYDVMDKTIIEGFLKAYKDRGKSVYAEIMKLPASVRNNIRVLPATAVLAGVEPTLDKLKKYGVPITKIYDVLRKSKDGTNVLTRERRPSINVQEVSLIHSFDTGQEFHAVKKALAETTQGLILVHDQFIGTPEAVRIANAEYLVVTKKLLKTYDTHQQVLLAVKAYDTENTVANTSSYKSIKEEVNQGVERKIEIIDNSYNPEDGTVIGDKTNPIGALPEIDVDAVKTDKVHTPTVRDNTDSKDVYTPKNVTKELTTLKSIIDSNDADVITFDLETDSVDFQNANIVEFGYKINNEKASSIRKKLTSSDVDTYIKRLKNAPDAIKNSTIYKDIHAVRSATGSTKRRLLEAYNGSDTTLSPSEFKKKVEELMSGKKAVVGYNSVSYDSKVLNAQGFNVLSTTHDMMAYAHGVVDTGDIISKGKGTGTLETKAKEFGVTTATLHDSASDVDATFGLIDAILNSTPKSKSKSSKSTGKTPNKLEDMAKSSSIISSLVNMESKNAPKISITEAVNSYDLKTDTVNVNKDATVAQVEHEIIHSYTTGYIASELVKGDKANNTVRYIEKALNKLEAKSSDHAKATRKFKNRLAYILSQNSKEAMLNEFVAIMRTEPDFRSTAEKVLGTDRTKNNIWKTLKDLIDKAVNWINDADLASDTIDTLKLNAAVDYIIENGESMRTTKNKLFKKFIKKSPVKSLNFEAKTINKKYSQVSEFLNKGTSSILTSLTEKPALKLGATLDTLMMQNFPLYISARNRVIGEYKDFDTLRQLVDKISGGTVNKTIKADYLSAATKIKTERDALISSNNEKAKVLTSSLSDSIKGKLGRFINDMPLHNYFLYAESVDSESKLKDRIEVLTKTLDTTAIHKIKAIVDMNINGKVSRITDYNLNTKFPKDSSGNVYRELLALMSIEAIGSKDFFSLKENTDLMDFVKDLSLANSLLVTDFNGQQGMRDSLVMDYYKDPLEIREVTQDSIRNFDISNKTGWKILKEPTSSTLGAIYRPIIDSTSIDGVFTDIKMLSTDVTVQNNSNNYRNVVAGKLILTSKDKETMGLVKSPIEALVRSAAHNLAIKDSQAIRTSALKAEIHKEANTKDQLDELEDIIDDNSTETPWSIKSDIQYNALPARIKAEYKSVGKRASDVEGFNDEVTYVRKDIAHWFVGDSMPSLFTNPKLKWMVRATKTLMSSAKMGMAITNPIKVAKDNFSNLNYLAQLGVSPIFIDEEYRRVGRDFSEYNKLTTKRLDLRMKVIGNPNDKALQKKLASLDKKLKANSVSDLVSRGFTNSLGSHLVMQNSDTLSGMNTDIENTIKAVFLNSDGTNNKAARGLMKFANFGGNGENLVKYLSMTVDKLGVDSVKHVEEQAVEARNRISKIKTDNDVVGYVTQFAISPNSESVKLGAYVTDLIDMSAKETYYRHLTKVVGMDTEKARLKVIDAFPDYRENLPLAIKAASDLGILMFPSYWIPDIRNDYKLIRDRPLGVAVEALISNVTGLDMTNILDQNIISRATSWGGLIHSPSEAIGFNSLSPVF